jgi:hypothetical protein
MSLELAHPAASQRSESCGERGRIGAAIMAFLQCSNITIEPNIALYENASCAQEELRLFRRADEVDTCIYTDIALGRRRSIPKIALVGPLRPVPKINFDQPITGRRMCRNLSNSYPDQLAAQLERNVLAWQPNDQTDQRDSAMEG